MVSFGMLSVFMYLAVVFPTHLYLQEKDSLHTPLEFEKVLSKTMLSPRSDIVDTVYLLCEWPCGTVC